MPCCRLGLTALLVLALAKTAAGQGSVDVSKLPVNLERIQRQLRQAAVREERDGLNLRYVVDVFGQAPRIELFAPRENLLNGPVPYGAPTHRQFIEAITPREYRSPGIDFGAILDWLNKDKKDSRK